MGGRIIRRQNNNYFWQNFVCGRIIRGSELIEAVRYILNHRLSVMLFHLLGSWLLNYLYLSVR